MSEEENPMMERFDPPDPGETDGSATDDPTEDAVGEANSVDEADEVPTDADEAPTDADEAPTDADEAPTDADKAATDADGEDNTEQKGELDEPEDSDESSSGEDTRRSRPHTALYVSQELVDQVEERFRKINGRLLVDGEDPIEKHRHFYEGLLEAGLQNDDLEEIVMNQREE